MDSVKDLGAVGSEVYNEAAGANKVMIVQPDIKGPYAANTKIGQGRLVKITAAGVYSLVATGIDYDPTASYVYGSVAVQDGSVWVMSESKLNQVVTGTFDAQYWSKVAPAVIAGIPNAAGDVVSTGRWHNSINVAGFIVEDDTAIRFNRVR